ncbi:MAG TPA: hypothetical protein VM573_03725 [Actinomycetota bacterium]|nr:hypothetical protein [Actinomycetota bacterium]
MRSMRIALGTALVAALLAAPAAAADDRRAVDKSDNVRLVKTYKYTGVEDFFSAGTDIDFQGKWVYAMQQGNSGGVHVIDASKKVPKKVAFIACPGGQNDVAVVKPGLIAIGYHSSTCAGAPGGGVRLIDVKNPKRPKYLGAVNDLPGGTHTLTVYPGKPIIYASPGGLANGGGVEQILDVSDPRNPKVAATFTPNPTGCHDLIFDIRKDRKLAVCAGLGETQIWDVSDPLAPQTIGRIHNPLIFFHHSAAISPDGDLLVLGDENFGANECRGGPTGAMWAYDISNPAVPVPQGYFGINRGESPISSPDIDRGQWCTAHLFNFIPGTRLMVASWYAAGMNVIDWTNPATPSEVAHYQSEEVNYWSAYWYDGLVYANDRERGALDIFRVSGLKEVK